MAGSLVPREDPGRIYPWTGIASQTMVLLWLALAVAFAAWRFHKRLALRSLDLIEGVLAVFLVLVCAGAAFAAAYKNAAWLMASEWLGIVVSFCLIRRLGLRESDVRGFLAVLLATAVCLALRGIAEFGEDRFFPAASPAPSAVATIFREMHDGVLDEPAWQRWLNARPGRASELPSTLAGLLMLLMPAALVAGYAAWRDRQRLGRTMAVLGFVILIVGGLLSATLAVWSDPSRTARAWGEAWKPTWSVIANQPALGVGGGNFDRYFPRAVTGPASEPIASPPNLLLDLVAAHGWPAALAFLVAIGLMLWRIRTASGNREITDEPTPAPPAGPRWEFYLGGIVGLLLGLFLRLLDQVTVDANTDLVRAAIEAIVRSLVWFASFAAFFSLTWRRSSMSVSLGIGIVALALFLMVHAGGTFPALMQPLAIAAALALPAGRRALGRSPSYRLSSLAALAGLVPVILAYLVFVYAPLISSFMAVSQARTYYAAWQSLELPLAQKQKEAETGSLRKLRLTNEAYDLLQDNIVKHLEAAIVDNPGDANVRVEVIYWYAKQWEIYATLKDFPNVDERERTRTKQRDIAKRATEEAAHLRRVDPKDPDFQGPEAKKQRFLQLDPENRLSYAVAYRLRMLFAAQVDPTRVEQSKLAVFYGERMVALDPWNARCHYQLAMALDGAGQSSQAQAAARKAQEMPRSDNPMRRLSEEQVHDLQRLHMKPAPEP